MIGTPANCMLLDEPTNHLDMSSQEVLQEAMDQYDGTIVVVSHNRYFLDSFVNKVLEVRDGHLTLYEGNVAEYLRKMEEMQAIEAEKAAKEKPVQNCVEPTTAESRKERKRLEAERRQERSRRAGPWLKQLAEAEEQVEKFEVQKEELEAQMADPELYSDNAKWSEVSKDYEDCKRRLDRWYGKWETAQEKIDEIDAELAIDS